VPYQYKNEAGFLKVTENQGFSGTAKAWLLQVAMQS
jgi:hypothetical protein